MLEPDAFESSGPLDRPLATRGPRVGSLVVPLQEDHPKLPIKKRAYSKKVKSGCLTCKIRKIKCDEGKPYCLQCTRTGRKCDGYLPSAKETPGAIVIAGSLSEERAFDYFMAKVIPSMADVFDAPFWSKYVTRIGRTHRSIYHTIVSIASAFEIAYGDGNTENNEVAVRKAFTHEQIQLAVGHLFKAQTGNPSIEAVLSCILFYVLGSFGYGIHRMYYLASGMRMINELAAEKPKTSRSGTAAEATVIQNHLGPLFNHLRAMFGSCMDPLHSFNESLREEGLPKKNRPPRLPASFDNLFGAKDCLREILYWGVSMLTEREGEPGHYELNPAHRRSVEVLLELWDSRFELLRLRLEEHEDLDKGNELRSAYHLKGWRYFAAIILMNTSTKLETEFDAYIPQFREVVNAYRAMVETRGEFPRFPTSGTRPQMNFGLGLPLAVPLETVRTYCRDPQIRHEALELYSQLGTSPNFNRQRVSATVTQAMIALEESNLPHPVKSASDIPESNRYRPCSHVPYKDEMGTTPPTANNPGLPYRIMTLTTFMRHPFDIDRPQESSLVQVKLPLNDIFPDTPNSVGADLSHFFTTEDPGLVFGRRGLGIKNDFTGDYMQVNAPWSLILPPQTRPD